MSLVIQRVLQILGLLAPTDRRPDWSPAELSERSGIPLQTVYRILTQLEKEGWARRHRETRRYSVGYSLIQTGLSAWQKLSVREIARPVMERLSEQSGESVALTVRDGADAVLIDYVYSSQWLRLVEPVGLRIPLIQGAGRKILLAWQSPQIQQQILDELAKRPKVEHLVKNREEIARLMAELWQQGYAVSYGEITPGSVGVAAPVFDHSGGVVASITVGGPEDRFGPDRLPQVINLVRAASEEVSAQLRGQVKHE